MLYKLSIQEGTKSIAFPIIGGVQGVRKDKAIEYIKDEIHKVNLRKIVLVLYLKN